jgi:hypothetical protein
MFEHPAFSMAVAHERHRSLIAEAERRRLLAIARQARKERKARKKHARGWGIVPVSGRAAAGTRVGSASSDRDSLTPCRERAAAPAR